MNQYDSMVMQDPKEVIIVGISACLFAVISSYSLLLGAIVGYLYIVILLIYLFRVFITVEGEDRGA